MSRINPIILAIYIILLTCTTVLGQNATKIVRKANDKMRGKSSRAAVTMKIIRPSWQRSISLKTWTKSDDYSLILITEPARDEGSAYLKRKNEIWNWLPDVNRTVKMPPSMMSQSWMGSDFSNNDLVREASIVVDYNHSLMSDSTIAGRDCYKIKMVPKADAPVVWGKVIMFISKDENLQLRAEYYDGNGNLVRLMENSEIKKMDGRLIPTRMEMSPMEEEGKKTVMIYHDIEFNMDISKRFFSIQNMKRVE